jgi:opacity protein-like surface antigen
MNILKKIFAVVTIFFIAFTSVNAQHYTQGQVVVDAYYGFPNLYSTALESSLNSLNTTNSLELISYSASSIGPVGGRAEYLVTDNIGIGVDFSYTNTVATFSLKDVNNFSHSYNQVNSFTADVTRIRAMPRINIHFGEEPKFDPYFTFGLGYYYVSAKISADDPSVTPVTINGALIPVSTRAGLGCRYFFTDHIGAGVEIGLFGPLLTGGLTGKF